MSEFDVINHYFRRLSQQRQDVTLGIGDDCAILQVPEGCELAVSADTLVAGVHFPLTASAEDIGYKALAVNLSDLAAMGAQPAWVMLALTLPDANPEWLKGFVKGLQELMDRYQIQLVGGDTTHGALSITIQVFGFLPRGRALRRDAARPGDLIYVSGTLGDAGLGLKKALQQITSECPLSHCLTRLNRPSPRIELGQALLPFSRCAIDISDGLIADAGHIAEESKCAAIIHLEKIPLSDELKTYYGNAMCWEPVLAAGDDYELCFTLAPAQRESIAQLARQLGVPLTCIGEITAGQGVHCIDAEGTELTMLQAGYDHFK